MELKFKRDTSFRKQFFVPDSFAHPAKMDAQLLIWIVERYTKPGEVILDPMAGMGTTMLACTLGRNVVLVELEEKFCKMCKSNWEKVSAMPQLGYDMGQCNIIQGDARQLEGLLVDKIVTSPPFGEAQSGGGIARKGYQGPKHGPTDLVGKRSYMPENIGDEKNISNLPYGNIDSIITSPPYEEAHSSKNLGVGDDDRADLRAYSYLKTKTNGQIGNLKSQSYLEAMLQVYQQCFSILKKGGLMILVVKPFIRDQKLVPLQEDTKQLCQQAGFSFVEEHHRFLPSQSFWRVIYAQRFPNAPKIDKEYVLVFRNN